jgi:hypothetical protein
MEEKLINEEVIKYQEKYIEDLEQQVELLKRTILKQKKDIQTLVKQNHNIKLKAKKIEIDNMDYPLGYNPYQE